MKRFFQTGLTYDWKIIFATVVSTLLLIIERYYNFSPWKPLDQTLLYFIIPFGSIVLILRENPREYGFQLGDWRAGLALTGGALLLVIPLLAWFVRSDPWMRTYYRPFSGTTLPLYTFFALFGWEFLFRGWLTFTYARKFGGEGLWLQAVPFAIAHITKPDVETLSTIFGGFIFGWVAWRTKSFLYPLLIHWAIFTFVVLVAGGYLG